MTARKRVAVYDLYWSTLGGGEQVDGTLVGVDRSKDLAVIRVNAQQVRRQ